MSDFWVGFFVGLGTAGIFGFSLQQLRLWQKQWQAMTKPQQVQVKTSRTPWEVVSAGLQVGCAVGVALIVIAVILWLLFASPL